MEGPAWVVYAITGTIGNGDLPPGTLLDLEGLKTEGEGIEKAPVTEEEMTKLLKSL